MVLNLLIMLAALGAPPDFLNPQPSVQDLQKQLARVTAERDKLAGEQTFGAKLDLLNVNGDEMTKLRKERDSYKATLDAIEPFKLSGLAGLQGQSRRVYIQITTSPACGPCHQFVAGLRNALVPLKWTIGEDGSSYFQIVVITQEEWTRRQLTLPLVELISDGVATPLTQRDPYQLANILLAEINRVGSTYGAADDQAYGYKVTTVKGRPQVEQLLNQLEPFLDGGTLTLLYEPRPGVVREKITIKQGAGGITIPAKLAFKLNIIKSANEKELLIVPIGQPPTIIASFLERNIKQIELTPTRLSIRLPWMVDPEVGIE